MTKQDLIKSALEEFDKEFGNLYEKLEGDGPMWFWNGETQIYVSPAKKRIADFISKQITLAYEEGKKIGARMAYTMVLKEIRSAKRKFPGSKEFELVADVRDIEKALSELKEKHVKD